MFQNVGFEDRRGSEAFWTLVVRIGPGLLWKATSASPIEPGLWDDAKPALNPKYP